MALMTIQKGRWARRQLSGKSTCKALSSIPSTKKEGRLGGRERRKEGRRKRKRKGGRKKTFPFHYPNSSSKG
jgi:hypothetical protein